MKKIKLALLILGISVFASCSGDALEDVGVDKETTEAKLTVIVRDVITGEAIDDAQVTLSSLTPVLAKGGTASFDNVRIGNHILKVEKTGYASIAGPVEIDHNYIAVNGTKGEYTFTANGTSVEVPMFPESANLYAIYILYQHHLFLAFLLF